MSNEQVLRSHFDKMVAVFHEKILLDDDVKLIKETLSAEGLAKEDVAAMVAAATAKAREKTEEAKSKATKVAEMLDRFA